MRPPTRQQLAALTFIDGYIRAHGTGPRLAEIAAAIGASQRSNAKRHVDALVRAGFLRRLPRRRQAIEVIRLPRFFAAETVEGRTVLTEICAGGIALPGDRGPQRGADGICGVSSPARPGASAPGPLSRGEP